MIPSGDDAFAASARLITALGARGLSGLVISPGSRSTPLVLSAARQQAVPVRVVLDERSAAFTALGLAKARGRAAAAICTSGTAAANMLPAAVEATASRTPLLLLTADRPPSLRDTGANQTIDQRGLFGAHAAWLDASVHDDWAALAAEAFDAAMGPPSRAVQVNLAFDEPLVPAGDVGPVSAAVAPWLPPDRRGPSDAERDRIRATIDGARVVVVAGPMLHAAPSVERLAASLSWPVLAEPCAQIAGLTAPHQVAANGPDADVVVQIGTAPTTRVIQAFVGRARQVLVLDPDGRRQDGGLYPADTIAADPEAVAAALLDDPPAPAPDGWLATWRAADAEARAALDAALDADPRSPLRLARDVAAAVPSDAILLAGNSGPIRDLCEAMLPRQDLTVVASRGASGIDGQVSTAFGIAWSGRPTAALLGDLTLLHDASGFVWGARHGADATLIVINNAGGRIFDRLPVASLPEHRDYFVTPHDADIDALAAAAGARHVRADDVPAAVAALGEALPRAGVDLIEVVLD